MVNGPYGVLLAGVPRQLINRGQGDQCWDEDTGGCGNPEETPDLD